MPSPIGAPPSASPKKLTGLAPVTSTPATSASAPAAAPSALGAPTPLGPLAGGALAAPSDGPAIGRRGSKRTIALGASSEAIKGVPAGTPLSLSATGRILVDGKLPSTSPGVGADGTARAALASRTALGSVFAPAKLDEALETKVRARLLEGLAEAASLEGSSRRVLESATTCLLIDLASAAPKGPRLDACATAALDAIEALGDREMAAFYLASAVATFGKKAGPAVRAQIDRIDDALLPAAPPVDAWTKGRTQPVIVSHTLHEEFWKEELAYFTAAHGFTLVSKDAKDTERKYAGLIPDPAGKLPPLAVKLTVRKGEMDYLDAISDPATHVILYSGHSALGGNGDQALDAAGPMKGPHPKLVMAANCRGKDNYAAFTNKYPRAHVIMTDLPTYATSGQARIDALFKTLAAGGDYASMRKLSDVPVWDEPADNYFYPDEWRKFLFMDADSDGKTDALGDRYFDPTSSEVSAKFVRAVNFTNTELYYHEEVEREEGRKPFFGKAYADALIADGRVRGEALPEGRLVEVHRVDGKAGGKAVSKWRVRYDPKRTRAMDENLYAGMATMQTVLALTVDKSPAIKIRDALRAVLMGAQAIYYLDVYSDSNPKNQKAYFEKAGLGDIAVKDIDKIFAKFDAHASTPQLVAFRKLLEEKYGLDLEQWLPTFLAANAPATG